MISGEDFERTIQNFDRNFSLHLMDLLEKLSHYSTIDCEHQMLNIIARLDHNGYYTAQLEKKAAEGETSIFLITVALVIGWEVNKSMCKRKWMHFFTSRRTTQHMVVVSFFGQTASVCHNFKLKYSVQDNI